MGDDGVDQDVMHASNVPKRQKKLNGRDQPIKMPSGSNTDPRTTQPMQLIDGSMLEGGGQIVRNAVSLAAITHQPITINNIRAKRSKPGLRPQHLQGLLLAATVSNGTLTGGHVGSTQITFLPAPAPPRSIDTHTDTHTETCGITPVDRGTNGQEVTVDTGTAGSCMLLVQVALPCLMCAPARSGVTTLTLRGGTDVPMAPPVDYMRWVFLPTLRHAWQVQNVLMDVDIEVVKRGFYPKGQGIVKLVVKALSPVGCHSASVPPIRLTDRGKLDEIKVFVFTAGRVKDSVGERMASAAEATLKSRSTTATGTATAPTITIVRKHEPPEAAFGDGCGIVIVASTSNNLLFGSSALGERGVGAETVGQRAADDLADVVFDCPGACVDDCMMDQLIIFMALAQGESEVVGRVPSLHTHTAVAVAEQLTDCKFEITRCTDDGDELWKVKCRGAGIVVGGSGDGSGGGGMKNA